jgi:NADH-quinone oxidoreductase subunit J
MQPRKGDWILAAIVGGMLVALLIQAGLSVPEWQTGPAATATSQTPQPTTTAVGEALLGVRVDALSKTDSAQPANTAVLSGYLLPFEIVSVHLLVVLIGAAYLARAKRRPRSRFAEG